MRSRMLAIAIVVVSAWGCGSSGSSSTASSPSAPTTPTTPSSNPITVSILGQKSDQSFNPNPVPLAQGNTVIWQNNDSIVHRIVMNDGSFDSGNIAPGSSSAAMRLSSSGGSYHCAIHPTTMFGSVNVATDTMPSSTPAPGY